MARAARARVRGWQRTRRRARARDRLLRMIPARGVGAEIGVWKGAFSAELLARTNPAKLHLVDPWAFQPEFAQSWFGGTAARSQADMDAIHDGVAQRFAAEIDQGRVEILRAPSVEAAARIEPGTLDWVYIDGNHDYRFVLDDLEAFTTRVRPGGLVAGDDYGTGGWWQGGVKQAVDEWVDAGHCELVAVLEDQFVLRRPAAS